MVHVEPKTINNHLKVLSRILRVAHKWNLIADMPRVGHLEERKSEFNFLDF
jgi:hypothetical protein